MQSSTATSSASVELPVLSFCFLDKDMIAPFPIFMAIPEWLFLSRCTANASLMLHATLLVSPKARDRFSVEDL